MTSKHVLVVAYHFPPIGGAGAQRPARLARHLQSEGYASTVITGPGSVAGRWTPDDPALGDEIPASVDVRRIASAEPNGATHWGRRLDRWLGRPSAWARWWIDGVGELGRSVERVDLVYAYMSPYESAEAAARLATSIGRPWVADLGDPWALDEMMVFPSRWHRTRETARMRHWLGRADGVIMSTPEAVARVRDAFPELQSKPMVAVPNGFEASDFAGDVTPRDDRMFRIVHTGYLHTDLGRRQKRASYVRRLLGGESSGVDILTRSHVYLLQALDRLLEDDATLATRIEAVFAGVLSEADREVGAQSPVARLLGYVPHVESTNLIRTADLLFLPMQNLPEGVRATIVPGKTYEYLATGRPILAAVPNGDVREILSRAGSASMCDPDDVAEMAALIRKAIEQFERGQFPAVDRAFVAQFEYGSLAKRVASFLGEVLAGKERLDALPISQPPVGGRSPRRVAYLAYYFPPIGGAGAQRSLKFVRYLPEHDYHPVVITGPGRTPGRWSPSDETLVREVPHDVEVWQVPGPEPASSTGRRRRAESWLGMKAPWRAWWVEGAVALAPNIDVDLIFASMSPYASAEAAARIATAAGKPWIAELRDPWALDEMMVFPTSWHRRLEFLRMERALATASAVVMNTPEAAARLRACFPRLSGVPVVCIPNGYDGEDFAGVAPRRSDDAFRIVHTGYFHTELGRSQHRMALKSSLLGGAVSGVDILTRSHIYLLRAVAQVIARDPSAPVEVHFAGQLSEADVAVARGFPFVHLHGYLPHAESVGLLRSADLLFLPMQDLPPTTRATIVPGKTYEYLAARRPILAAIPRGDARDLLLSSGIAEITEPSDVGAMTRAIEAQLQRWRVGEQPLPDEALLESFERRRLTALLASVYDAVLDHEPSVALAAAASY